MSEFPPLLHREVPRTATKTATGQDRDQPAPQLERQAAEDAETDGDPPQSGPPALRDLIMVDPEDLARLLNEDGDAGRPPPLDASLDSIQRPEETPLPASSTASLCEAKSDAPGPEGMDTLGVTRDPSRSPP